VGSIRSPLWRHGGIVHGPHPRSYEYKLPRKMVLGALRSALSAKLRDGQIKVVRAFELGDHKTKSMVGVLGKLEVKKTVLLVEAAENTNLSRASRNLPGVKLVPTKDVTVYDLLKHQQLVLSEMAAKKLSEALAK
jgi:large subunit ribosomal protein L4